MRAKSRLPMQVLKLLITAARYIERHITATGEIRLDHFDDENPHHRFLYMIWKTECFRISKKNTAFYDRVTKLQYTFPGSHIM